MSRSLVLSFQSASAKYSRLHKKIKKSVARGDFFRFTRKKRNHLLARIEKLRKRLVELRTQIRLAGAGLAAAAIFSVTTADAQTSAQFGTKVGPFIQNELKNPLPAPPFTASQTGLVVQFTEVQYHDFDKDGDLDAILTFGYRTRIYYQNVGTATQAKWKEREIGEIFQASLPGPNYADNFAHQTYADLDDDGDLDAIAAVNQTQTNPSPDNIFFMENVPATNKDPYFTTPTSDLFPGIIVNGAGWPVLADVDGDGDSDLILAGRYFDVDGDQNAFIQYFRNDKVGHTPGELPTFTPVTGQVDNPFYLQDLGYNYVAVNFADLDEDGDQDFIYTAGDASTYNTFYKKNNGGTFIDQVGPWNATNGTGNPFNSILSNIAITNGYVSLTFGDLDGDGDEDATVGLASPLNTSLEALYPFRYLENKGKGVFDFSEENQIEGHLFGDNLTSTMFDHDGDGDLDIVTVSTRFMGVGCEGSYCGQQYYVSQQVYLNDNGQFSSNPIEVAMPSDFPTNGSNFVQLIDVEGDGDLDILSNFDFDGSKALMYWRNDDGDYTQLEGIDNPFDFANDPEFPYSIPSMADLNNDGLKDLILLSSYPGASAYKNTGTKAAPVFEYDETWNQGLVNIPPYESAIPSLVDMDGDGDYDLVVSKYSSGVWYFQNQGTKEAPDFGLYTTGQLDKDGQPVSIEYWGENPFAFFNEKLGYFNMADVDGDGDRDLLFGEYQRGIFKLYENQNPAPTVQVSGNTPTSFTLNQPVTLITSVTIDDPDDDFIVKVVATVTPFKPGNDKLELIGNFGSGVVANWVDTTGILTITGPDTTNWTGVLKGIQYTYVGSGSSGRTSKQQHKNGTQQTVNRTVEIVTYDSDLTKEATNTRTFNLSGDDGGNQAPIIIAPRKTAASGGNIAFYISQIAEDLDGQVVPETAQVTSEKGIVQFASDHDLVTIDYSQDKTYQGTDDIFVSVCDNLGACTSSTFTVDIKADIVIFTGMSPNNDQVNDWFHIDYLPEGTHVAIYNRWGDLIYEESNYNVDDPARRFEGKNKNGTEVIAGTYYYKVKYPGGSTKSGYILLNR